MTTSSSVARAEALLAFLEQRLTGHMRRTYLGALGQIRSRLDLGEIERLVAANDIEGALRSVANASGAAQDTLRKGFTSAVREAGVQTTKRAARTIAPGMVFGGDNIRMQQALGRLELQFFPPIFREQEQTLRAIFTNGIRNGQNPRDVAIAARASVGLTAYDHDTINSFHDALASGRMSDALGRSLRDSRYDATLKAVRKGTRGPLTTKEVSAMTTRYQERLHKWRAETWTRTATLNAAREGQMLSWEEAAEQSGLVAYKTWHTTIDGRERQTHHDANGVTVPLNASFPVNGGVRTPGENEYNCRCTFTVSFRAPTKIEAPRIPLKPDEVGLSPADLARKRKRERAIARKQRGKVGPTPPPIDRIPPGPTPPPIDPPPGPAPVSRINARELEIAKELGLPQQYMGVQGRAYDSGQGLQLHVVDNILPKARGLTHAELSTIQLGAEERRLVKIADLRTTQDYLEPSSVKRYMGPTPADAWAKSPPSIIQMGDELIIADGNHSIVAARLRGDTEIEVFISRPRGVPPAPKPIVIPPAVVPPPPPVQLVDPRLMLPGETKDAYAKRRRRERAIARRENRTPAPRVTPPTATPSPSAFPAPQSTDEFLAGVHRALDTAGSAERRARIEALRSEMRDINQQLDRLRAAGGSLSERARLADQLMSHRNTIDAIEINLRQARIDALKAYMVEAHRIEAASMGRHARGSMFKTTGLEKLTPTTRAQYDAAKDFWDAMLPNYAKDATSDLREQYYITLNTLQGRGRSYVSGTTMQMYGSASTKTWVHEMSHIMESYEPKAGKWGVRERNLRRSSKIYKNLPNYDKDEFFYEGSYIKDYMGKEYSTSRHTEMLSMAMEMLYMDPVKLRLDDPRLFDALMEFLRTHRRPSYQP